MPNIFSDYQFATSINITVFIQHRQSFIPLTKAKIANLIKIRKSRAENPFEEMVNLQNLRTTI